MEKLTIFDIPITNLTSEELNEMIYDTIVAGGKKKILHVNIHAFNLAKDDIEFRSIIQRADIVFCDGDGVRIGALLLGKKIKEKITYNRWIWQLAKFSAKNNFSWYILGSTKEVISRAVYNLEAKFPSLRIAGYHNGYLSTIEANNSVIKEIKTLKPNILIIGMGMPLQEKWLSQHFEELDFNVALTGGAVFDYVSGRTKMTPDIFYKLKLEWLFRLFLEPRRLYKRYIYGNPKFFLTLIIYEMFPRIMKFILKKWKKIFTVSY